MEQEIGHGSFLEVFFPPRTTLPSVGGTERFPVVRSIIPLDEGAAQVNLQDGRYTVILVYQEEGQKISSGPFGTTVDLVPLRTLAGVK